MASKTPPNGRGKLSNPARPMKMTPSKRGIGRDVFPGPKPPPRKAGPRKIVDTGSLTLNRYKKGSDVLVKQMKKGK